MDTGSFLTNLRDIQRGMSMKKRIYSLILAAVLLLGLCGCNENTDGIPVDAFRTFQKYLEACENRDQDAFWDLVHYEGMDYYIALESGASPFQCSDLQWTRVTDQLYYCSFVYSDGAAMTRFVGVVEGRWRVMTSVRNIPKALRESAGLVVDPNEKYEQHYAPNAVYEWFRQYSEACKQGYSDAVAAKYMYFKSAENQAGEMDPERKLTSYEMLSSMRVGYDLVIIQYSLATNQNPLETKKTIFVGVMDNELRIIPNVDNIPDELLVGVDMDLIRGYKDGTIRFPGG